MLTPKQIAALPEPLVVLVSELENSIIQDLCRRIVKANMLTPSAEWQLYKASIMRQSTDEVMRQIAKFTSKSQREVKSMMTDTCRLAINTDAKIYRSMGKDCDSFLRSVAFSNAIKAGIIKTNKLMQNFTGTTAQTSRKTLEKYLDTAYFEVTSGAFTYQQAITKAVTSLASDGIKCVKYASGRTDQVDVAVRRAVITSVGQTTGALQLKMAEDLDCDLVQVTAHMGARPSHTLWQGQVFSISGGSKKYRKLSEATGYGTGEGLKGWNCRHDFYPYFEGMSLADDSLINAKENAKDYADSQRQRAFERSIRKSKRRLAGLDAAIKDCTNEETLVILHKKFDRSSVILKGQECKFKAWINQTTKIIDSSRVQFYGYNRSLSQKVVNTANKEYAKQMSEYNIKNYPKTLALFNEMKYNNSPAYKLMGRYIESIDKGRLSPLAGFENYETAYNRIETEIVGTKTSNGILVTGQSKHFLERVFGTTKDPHTGLPRSGVEIDDIIEALTKGTPLTAAQSKDFNGNWLFDKQGTPMYSQKFLGKKCEVSVNSTTGILIQCNPKRR